MFDVSHLSPAPPGAQKSLLRLSVRPEDDGRRQQRPAPEPIRRGARFGASNLLLAFAAPTSDAQVSSGDEEGGFAENERGADESASSLTIFNIRTPMLRDLEYVLSPLESACDVNANIALLNSLPAAAHAWRLLAVHVQERVPSNALFRRAMAALCNILLFDRDVQTLACLCAVAALTNVDVAPDLFPMAALCAYNDWLQRAGRFERRCEFERAMHHFLPAQSHCRMSASEHPRVPPETRCSLCRVVLSGNALVAACAKCSHGGHVAHVKAWFAANKECATGCGCVCMMTE